jgi:GNAT superfamily N-acetyltransferase
MMRAAMDLAAAKGAYKLALSSNLRRLDAHRFYDGMGFKRHGYSFSTDILPHD